MRGIWYRRACVGVYVCVAFECGYHDWRDYTAFALRLLWHQPRISCSSRPHIFPCVYLCVRVIFSLPVNRRHVINDVTVRPADDTVPTTSKRVTSPRSICPPSALGNARLHAVYCRPRTSERLTHGGGWTIMTREGDSLQQQQQQQQHQAPEHVAAGGHWGRADN